MIEKLTPTVIVLCGGLGTRLRSSVSDRPKVLAPVSGAPFLDHLLRHMARQGFRDVVLSTGYLGEMIEGYVGDGGRWGLDIRYAREPEPLGTGGGLLFAAASAGIETSFIAMNGDTYFSGSMAGLLDWHRERRGAKATIALTPVAEASRYGTVETEPGSGAVTAFREKESDLGPAWINAGVYVLEPAVLADITEGRNVSIERDVFPTHLGRGLFGCRFPEAVFLDIGTPEDYARAPAVLTRSATNDPSPPQHTTSAH